jgi:hypothetical protein
LRINIPDWVVDTLFSLNVWRGQWLYWEFWLFGVHIFTFTIPPFNFIPGIRVYYTILWLTEAANNIFLVVGSGLDDLSDWRDFLWGQITGWITDRLNSLSWYRDWLVERAWAAIGDIANLWVEAFDVWNKIGIAFVVWWEGVWVFLQTWISDRATDAINTVWAMLSAIRIWWDNYSESLFQFLFNPWLFLWNTVVKPLLDNDIATISPLQPVLSWYNVVNAELALIVSDPGLWAFSRLEAFVLRNLERVRRAVTTVLELIW